MTICQFVLQPGTQQCGIIPAFELRTLSVTSGETWLPCEYGVPLLQVKVYRMKPEITRLELFIH